MFLAGFIIWNMDNIYCHSLTRTKRKILLPWSMLLEGHGWWHILTGLGKSLSPFYGLFLLMTLTWRAGGTQSFFLGAIVVPRR
jgi:hypothetical protein